MRCYLPSVFSHSLEGTKQRDSIFCWDTGGCGKERSWANAIKSWCVPEQVGMICVSISIRINSQCLFFSQVGSIHKEITSDIHDQIMVYVQTTPLPHFNNSLQQWFSPHPSSFRPRSLALISFLRPSFISTFWSRSMVFISEYELSTNTIRIPTRFWKKQVG